MAQERSISSRIIWQLLAALQGGCVAGDTLRQRSTSRFEAALPISERQVPSPDKPEKADKDEAELAVAEIIIDDLTASEAPEAAVSSDGAGEQAAARTAMASRTGIWRMTAPRLRRTLAASDIRKK